MSRQSDEKPETSNQMTERLDEFVDFVTGLVEPKKRPDVSLKRWHKTVLTGTKIQPQNKKVRQKTKKKSKGLTRKEFTDLGLFNLPTKSMKYADLLPVHDLWVQYIEKQLEPYIKKRENGKFGVPEVYDNSYDAFSKTLIKSDLHGAKVTVIASCNPSLVGQTGLVAMETRNTFKIISEDNRIRTIPKPESVFKIVVNGIEFKIFGKYLNIRPAERAVKKIKTIMHPDL
ncbi:ribonuclease P protein subunit p29 [Contarinia nasturtii]|uniref:ribonuclease P protein subunit p29 n=1 Tax=Contarinia nasturtii TaxID=265458 RepID=UPI0012D39731|nr:ribonuclease P protein subunit p29 [Contarinia nasturtii]